MFPHQRIRLSRAAARSIARVSSRAVAAALAVQSTSIKVQQFATSLGSDHVHNLDNSVLSTIVSRLKEMVSLGEIQEARLQAVAESVICTLQAIGDRAHIDAQTISTISTLAVRVRHDAQSNVINLLSAHHRRRPLTEVTTMLANEIDDTCVALEATNEWIRVELDGLWMLAADGNTGVR